MQQLGKPAHRRKAAGAGGVGFILFFAETKKHAGVKQALSDLLYVPFKLESSGSQIIYFNE
jgi:D-glycero-alpha-D-manno-heptose-7-phosphate kinase